MTVLACINRDHRAQRDNHRLAPAAKARKKRDGFVTELELVNSLRMNIQHDLTVFHEGLWHLDTRQSGSNRNLRREPVIEGPLV